MKLNKYQVKALQDAVVQVYKQLQTTPQEIIPWWEYKEDDLWRELAACILGSRVSYELAVKAIQYLWSIGLMELKWSLRDPSGFEKRLIKALSYPFFHSKKRAIRRCYPFPFARANHLRRSLEAIYFEGGSIRNILIHSKSGVEARLNLVSIATGIGPKQASLFLRNIGYADDLAVLDTHVLRYIRWIGLVFDYPIRVHSIKKYERVEKQFRSHAQQLGFSVAQFDIAVWVATRVAWREFQV